MNISAINASSTLGRPQVPRNNVSFSGRKEVLHNAGEAVKRTGGRAKNGIVNFFRNAKVAIDNFVKNNKGARGVKIAATALTAVVAGGFAVKEMHDIATDSNKK